MTMMRVRRAERLLLFGAAIWGILLAAITLLPYQMWLTSTGYSALETAGELESAAVVTEVAAVVRLYGVALLLGSIITGVVAWRMRERHSGAVVIWVIVCTVAALITRDLISVVLLIAAIAVYLSRSRAAKLTRARPEPAV